jgi:TRAP transporter TAXI family solute receptor
MKKYLIILSMLIIGIFLSLNVNVAQAKLDLPEEMIIAFEELPDIEGPPITGPRFDEAPDLKREARVKKPGWPAELTVGIAPVGGTYYIWGGGFAKLMDEKVGIPTYMVVTGGPVHNTERVDARKLDLGMVTSTPVWEGWYGTGWARGKKHQNVRTIFPMYSSYFQMYALKKSGIKSIGDLNGKSVGLGPVGGTAATYWPMILDAAGVKPGKIVHDASADLDAQLKAGTLDANAQAVGLPWVLITALESTHEINILNIPKAELGKIIAKYPHFSRGVIPKGYYKSNKDYELETIAVWNFMVVHKDVPNDLVYEIVKKTFENRYILIAAHPSARETKPEFIVNSPIPIHPGAVKYYREKGIILPDYLIY